MRGGEEETWIGGEVERREEESRRGCEEVRRRKREEESRGGGEERRRRGEEERSRGGEEEGRVGEEGTHIQKI